MVHAVLAQCDADKLGETCHADGVVLVLQLPAQRLEALKALLRDATRDRARVEFD